MTDWNQVFSDFYARGGDPDDDDDSLVPSAPKRAASNYTSEGILFDHWFKDCGHAVSTSDPVFSQISTDWTKYLRQITYDARKAEAQDKLRLYAYRGRFVLDYLSECLEATAAAKHVHKKRKTAEMNSRYERVNGERVYVGKKKTAAKKAKRAAAARKRRAREKAKLMAVSGDQSPIIPYNTNGYDGMSEMSAGYAPKTNSTMTGEASN